VSREPTSLDARRKARSRGSRCPVCRQAAVGRFMPFCSRRCADEDLGRWLAGKYTIPGVEPADGTFHDEGGEDDDGSE
jgi:hypothetical protein